jgi:hypothetical protein
MATVGLLYAMAVIVTVGSFLFGFWWAAGIGVLICALTHYFGTKEFKEKHARDLDYQMERERSRAESEERARKSARWDE